MKDIENVVAGIYLALCGAIGIEGTHRANEILLGLAADNRTPTTEADIYRDIVDCVEDAIPLSVCRNRWWDDLNSIAATVH